jgi:hypothetical protein
MVSSARLLWGLAHDSPSSPGTGSKECSTIFSKSSPRV